MFYSAGGLSSYLYLFSVTISKYALLVRFSYVLFCTCYVFSSFATARCKIVDKHTKIRSFARQYILLPKNKHFTSMLTPLSRKLKSLEKIPKLLPQHWKISGISLILETAASCSFLLSKFSGFFRFLSLIWQNRFALMFA